MVLSSGTRVLIIEARFYQDIADELVRGAIEALSKAGMAYELVDVPGALEIPIALCMAHEAGLFFTGSDIPHYSGCVALGCVIRGETSHYDIVAGQSAHALMQIATSHNIPLGNGILTVETREQALVRAQGGEKGKGGDAARACLRLLEIMSKFQGQAE